MALNDDEADFLHGRLLIAMPGIGDSRFERAVILICAHSAEYALGIAVNRERGFVLHTSDFATDDSTMSVTDAVSLTPTREVLEAMVDSDRRPRHSVLALGCAQWASGQLEQEIRESVWLACDADEDLIFDDDHDSKWTRALAKIGVRADMLSAQGGRA